MSAVIESPMTFSLARTLSISLLNCASASARPGTAPKIRWPSTNATLADCARAVGTSTREAASAIAPPVRVLMKTPRLKNVAKSEMRLPARIRPALRVQFVEAIGLVEPQWPERGYNRDSDSRAFIQPRRVELPGAGPQVAGIQK